MLPHSRLGSHRAGVDHLSLHRRRATWLDLGPLHLSPRQWLRGLSTVRGWHDLFGLGPTSFLPSHVRRERRRIPGHLQELGKLGTYQHHRIVHRALRRQRHRPRGVCRPADYSRHQHPAGPVASGSHCARSLLLRDWAGLALRLWRWHLQQCPALH